MRVVKLPEGEMYLEKKYAVGANPFIFPIRATDRKHKGGMVLIGRQQITTPKELVGKKIMFKIEIIKPKRQKK